MTTCEKCGNRMITRKVAKKVDTGMGKHRKRFEFVEHCAYCAWKGDIGPGAELKQMIKERSELPKPKALG